MESVKTQADYGPVICATAVWAGASAFVATVVGVPLWFLGVFVLRTSPWNLDSLAPIASGVACVAAGGVLIYGVFRCVALSCISVLRSPGYPERHWWLARRAFQRVVRTELILMAVLGAAIVWAVRSHGRLADHADLAVGIAGAIFAYYQLVVVASMNEILRHGSVVPYFRKRVGEIDTFCSGQSLARHVDELDEVARTHGVTSLSEFGWNDDLEDEPLVWHAAAAGLKTVNFLLNTLEQQETGWHDHAAIIADLKRIAHALERADAQEIPFSLLLRHSTLTSGQEWDTRKGTCF
jgi:hypothetical protein